MYYYWHYMLQHILLALCFITYWHYCNTSSYWYYKMNVLLMALLRRLTDIRLPQHHYAQSGHIHRSGIHHPSLFIMHHS